MKSKYMAPLATAIALLLAFCATLAVSPVTQAKANDKLGLIIIFPGGPGVKKEGKKMINQFAETLAKMTGINPDDMDGHYFNKLKPAKKSLKNYKSSFILSSLGFFLANKSELKLAPLAKLKLSGDSGEQFFLLVKKNKYKSLQDLKGKKLAGSTLFEDKQYLNKIIFDGKIDVSTHFTLKPTARPLSAVRKVAKEKLDAVLINQIQHQSLVKLPLFDELEIIYASKKFPPLGLMMTETSRTKKLKAKVLEAVTKMCDTKEGKPVCNNFGLNGFETLKPGALDNVVKKFNSGDK